jgi:UDP-N-acetylmuramyl pentapeptide phosphotransferase/UDP-N-acetylglucosamine-1-phosphate transferase
MNRSGAFFAGAGVTAGLFSWILVALLIRLAPRIGLVDRPNERSLHTRVTPRGGGIALVLVVTLGLGLWWVAGLLPAVNSVGSALRGPPAIYLCAAIFIAAVSLRDDFQSLSAGLRFGCQLAVAVAAVWGLGYFRQVSIPGCGRLDLGAAGAGLTVIWVVGLTNVYNFMDGIDGMAGAQGVSAGLAWTLAGIWLGAPLVSLLAVLVAGGCLGFLGHNWSPAKIFMGDVGSAFLGYTFAVLPLMWLNEAATTGHLANAGAIPCFALLTVWPFVGDGFYTFLRRLARGEAVWKPHRSHLYQRLVQSGWTHAQVSSLYALWAVISGGAAVYWLNGGAGAAAVAGSVPPVSLAGIFLLVKKQERATGRQHV